MQYEIKITYQTGNSFGSNEEEDIIPYEWTDFNKVQEALKAINDHHIANNEYEFSSYNDRDKLYEKYINEPWLELGFGSDFRFSLKMPLDNGTYQSFSAFWHGHFERLISVEIITKGLRYDY